MDYVKLECRSKMFHWHFVKKQSWPNLFYAVKEKKKKW